MSAARQRRPQSVRLGACIVVRRAGCCAECFADSEIRKYIGEHGARGYCEYCAISRAAVLAPSELKDLFMPLMQQYEITTHGEHYDRHTEDASDHGEPLIDAIESDWIVFSSSINRGRAADLLDDILNSDSSAEEHFDTSSLWTSVDNAIAARSAEDVWYEFSYEIRHRNRFLQADEYHGIGIHPQALLTRKRLKKMSIKLPQSKQLFRARLGGPGGTNSDSPFERGDMGAPPAQLIVRGGRLNAPGIRMFYASDDKATCVAEVRPWRGAAITVASIALRSSVRVVDLTNPQRLLLSSPFGHEDLRESMLLADILTVFGARISEPINQSISEIEYVPTQYIAELIKSRGFDGILYDSALHAGKNLVLFDPDSAVVQSTTLMTVENIAYQFSQKGS